MLHNKSFLITTALIAVGYYLISKMNKEDKREVVNFIQEKTTRLVKEKVNAARGSQPLDPSLS